MEKKSISSTVIQRARDIIEERNLGRYFFVIKKLFPFNLNADNLEYLSI